MTISKLCDECEKEIEEGFSEWCVYHWKKRRDFCSDQCFLRFVMKKLVIDKKEDGN